MDLDLKIVPFTKDDITHDTLRVSVDYDKNVKGPVMTLQTAQIERPSYGGSFFRFSLFGSPRARVVIERGWKMNNKKRMEAARDQVKAEIAGKFGDSWAAIEKLLTENGSGLAPEVVEAAVA